jgi:hypothetical protein
MLPVRKSGGPGRRYRQREQERAGKKEWFAPGGGIARKNAGICLGRAWNALLERPWKKSPSRCRYGWEENGTARESLP